jgi:hypothetical protein
MPAPTSGSNLESLGDQQIAQHVKDLEARLIAEYTSRPDIGEDRVLHILGLVRERFADARVHAFLPILFERVARDALNH